MAHIGLENTFRSHPKIKRLARQLDISFVTAKGHIVTLWAWAIDYAPDGNLASYDPEDVEEGAEWEGASRKFIDAAVAVGLLDGTVADENLEIHGWMKRAHSWRRAHQKRQERQDRNTKKDVGDTVATTDATVAPPPTPLSPLTEQNRTELIRTDQNGTEQRGVELTASAVVAAWNVICGPAGLSEVKKLTKGRKDKVNARTAEEGWSLEHWRRYFSKISKAQAALGQNDRNWRMSFDVAVRSEQIVAEVFEGKYDEPWGTQAMSTVAAGLALDALQEVSSP